MDKAATAAPVVPAGVESTYKASQGGGGVTGMLRINNISVTFGHGARHAVGVDISKLSEMIATDVVGREIEIGSRYVGTVTLEGQAFQYRAFKLGQELINVGTYFPVSRD